MNKVKLISVTKPVDNSMTAQDLMAYCARVSSPHNQDNHDTADKLLDYCMKHGHWSVFEMAHMTVEITTSRAISAQILRHKSFNFQEFSQRYSEVTKFETYKARRQDKKNRQNSLDDLSEEDRKFYDQTLANVQLLAHTYYAELVDRGVAKECARMLLPMSVQTKLYMSGSIRSWIHYLKVRCDEATQLEHREIALEIRDILMAQFPVLTQLIRRD